MNDETKIRSCTAFRGSSQIATGPLEEVALKLRALAPDGQAHGVLVFDDTTAQQIDLDLRGTPEQVLQRIAPLTEGASPFAGGAAVPGANAPQARPGRPKLGVLAREVTLLPRHWGWLNRQPGGASVALRKLVDEARRSSIEKDRVRQSQDAAYKFMSAMAGNQEGYEEAIRALFARDRTHFEASIQSWPADLGKHAKKLAALALQGNPMHGSLD